MKKRSERKSYANHIDKNKGRVGEIAGLRIIGGQFRGRKLQYSGDIRTRPMKERVREAIFNLLGANVANKEVFDLFAGTGALALEAISRGAHRAIVFEQHYPTASIIRQNVETLGVTNQVEIIVGNVFIQIEKFLEKNPSRETPWLVFCSPPYDFFVSRHEEMLQLITKMLNQAPPASIFVVEADDRFNFGDLPNPDQWEVRSYLPAVVGVLWI